MKCNNVCLFQGINKEESLLDKEQSQFPILQTIMAKKQPYDQLWITGLDFQTKSDVWMNGKTHAVIFPVGIIASDWTSICIINKRHLFVLLRMVFFCLNCSWIWKI